MHLFLQPEEGEDIISAIVDAADGRYAVSPITHEMLVCLPINRETGCLRILQVRIKTSVALMAFVARLTS